MTLVSAVGSVRKHRREGKTENSVQGITMQAETEEGRAFGRSGGDFRSKQMESFCVGR